MGLFGRKRCDVNPGIDALENAVELVAGTFRASVIAGVTAGNPAVLLGAYGVLLPNLFGLLADIDDLPCEVKALHPADCARLVAVLVKNLGIPSNEALKLLSTTLAFLHYIDVIGEASEQIIEFIDSKKIKGD